MQGLRTFLKTMTCRYCFLSPIEDYDCVKAACQAPTQFPHRYKTNCTVKDSVLCLGQRTFPKKVPCNWTSGYRWSTALILSITLGGFGADRFYLGHWQVTELALKDSSLLTHNQQYMGIGGHWKAVQFWRAGGVDPGRCCARLHWLPQTV